MIDFPISHIAGRDFLISGITGRDFFSFFFFFQAVVKT